MRYSSIVASLVMACFQPLCAEVRLTLVNETPYGVFVHYTTKWEKVTWRKSERDMDLDKRIDIRHMMSSHSHSYEGAPVYIAPYSRYLLYHAGIVNAQFMYLEAVDPQSKKKVDVRLYCEGVSHERYDASWLYHQVWQDGDRWNWTLWIKAE